jgi:hypothetical protein
MLDNALGLGNNNHNITLKVPKEYSAPRTKVEGRRSTKIRHILVTRHNKQPLLLINSSKEVFHN